MLFTVCAVQPPEHRPVSFWTATRRNQCVESSLTKTQIVQAFLDLLQGAFFRLAGRLQTLMRDPNSQHPLFLELPFRVQDEGRGKRNDLH